MRFSTAAVFAAAAIGAQAFPQDVQPITQISDGQIQAPPATASAPSAPAVSAPGSYEVPTAPAPTEVLPSVVPSASESAPAPPVEVSSVYNTPVPVAPSAPAGTGAPAPYPISSSAVYTNGTAAPTGSPATSAPGAGETSGGSPQPTDTTGRAATAYVSVGALFAGLFAFLA